VALLAHLNADGYDRKLLLYASALCALHPEFLTQLLHDWHSVVETVLRGVAHPSALNEWYESTTLHCGDLTEGGPAEERAFFSVLYHVVGCNWISDPQELDIPPLDLEEAWPMRQLGANIIRDIYGNPFRPVSFDAAWRTSTVVALAQQMYESRDFSAMPILADALQDAGCENDDILNHCRDANGIHVRGCWVVDLVLDKM